jgi:uncharacterized protein YdhG (YjbR/CyaY superfamily)
MAAKPKTIDDDLAGLSGDQRAALEQLRETIRAVAPEAEECISYQLPAFRLDGPLVAFGATANHCAFYVMSGSTLEAYQDDLQGYETSKGTIRFQPDAPLPATLVRKLVKARIAENAGRGGKSKTPARASPGGRARTEGPPPRKGRSSPRRASARAPRRRP